MRRASGPRRIDVSVQRHQGQRQAKGCLELKVRQVHHSIRIETEHNTADGRRDVTSSERPRQRVSRQRGQGTKHATNVTL